MPAAHLHSLAARFDEDSPLLRQIGRFFSDWRNTRWFPVPAAAPERAERRFRLVGLPVLLLSWVPIIGDPITLVAGLLRVRLIPFLLVVTIAKGGRYLVLAAIVPGIVRL